MKLLLWLVVAFAFGVLLGVKVARLEFDRLGLEEIVGLMREGLPDAKLRLRAIEAAEKGDNAKALQINCLSLRLQLSLIKPDAYDQTKAGEVRAFLEEAHSEIAKLQQAGACSFGQTPRPG